MRNFKFLSVLGIALLTFSCSQESMNEADLETELLIESFKKTIDYKNFQSAGFDFAFSTVKRRSDNAGKSSLLIDLLNGEYGRSNLLSSNDNGRLSQLNYYNSQIISIFENEQVVGSIMISNLSNTQNIFENINEFDGQIAAGLFNSRGDYEEIYLTFEDGTIVSVDMEHLTDTYSSSRTDEVADLRSWGYCIGEKFQDAGEDCIEQGKGCAEEATCYIGFGLCLVARAIDCAVEEG